MSRTIFILGILISSVAQGDEMLEWPLLSQIKFVAERPATESDINEGAAVFLLQSGGKYIGLPMSIDIPQYAVHTDIETGEQSNVVVIQAEEANGQQVIGAFVIKTSEYMVGLINEFKFLGKSQPETK